MKIIKFFSFLSFLKEYKESPPNCMTITVRRAFVYLKSTISNFFNKKSFFRYKCTIIAHEKMKKCSFFHLFVDFWGGTGLY